MRTFDADYVSHNNHGKHAERSNNCVSMPTHVFSRVRNDSMNLMDFQNEAAMCYLG